MYKLCSIHKLSEKELLTNYDLLNKSLYRIVPTATDLILRHIKFEMLPHAVLMIPNLTVAEIQNPTLSIPAILNLIRNEEILKFVREIPSHEHVAIFYENENFRDNILSMFFNTGTTCDNTPKGLLSSKPADSNSDYNLNTSKSNNILYSESLNSQKREAINQSLHEWIQRLQSSNKSQHTVAKIANQDATWWLRNDSANEYIQFQKSLGRNIQYNISAICAYNISKLNNEYIRTIIASHNYIIFDRPFIIYKNTREADIHT